MHKNMVSKTKQIKDLKLRVSALIDTCNEWERKYEVMEKAFDKITSIRSENERLTRNVDTMTVETRRTVEQEQIKWLREFVTLLTTGLSPQFEGADPLRTFRCDNCHEPRGGKSLRCTNCGQKTGTY